MKCSLSRVCLPIVALSLLAFGCRYHSMNAMGVYSPAPYHNLKCTEIDNDEGFSFEIPGCNYRNMSIRLRLRVERDPDDTTRVRYEQEMGFRDSSPDNDVLLLSSTIDDLEHLVIGGRTYPPIDECNPEDQDTWQRYQEAFKLTWENYTTVLPEIFKTCAEDRISHEITQVSR